LDKALGGTTRVFPSPVDWRDQWIYFIMIDRFNNPLAPPMHSPYDDPQYSEFQGGTFAGVRAQLPYIQKLGAGAIWLTPVLKNCQFSQDSYHGYGIQDFLNAEPRFAAPGQDPNDELRKLVDAAHDLGIYVIFDIVLNHSGDVFAYDVPGDSLCRQTQGSEATFSSAPLAVQWRDETGKARPDWTVAENIANPPPNATVWPAELRRNEYFRRQGLLSNWGTTAGDFMSLKQLLTTDPAVQNALIRVYQNVIAKYDVDGFRIDTLKYMTQDFACVFGNAIREFTESIGKKNFFAFGEVFGGETDIAKFIGRNASDPADMMGVDAALDFPLVFTLDSIAKGFAPPAALAQMYQTRKQVEQGVMSSHGDATKFFVTFIDNHDLKRRFYYTSPDAPHAYDGQLTMALAVLFSLQGIPCVYYGTEQGLHGAGSDAAVREALWGKQPNPFDSDAAFFPSLQAISNVRSRQPALRYGRQYFRPISGDGHTFGISPYNPGVLAFSRILNNQEVVVAANTDSTSGHSVDVIVDSSINPGGAAFQTLYSNSPASQNPWNVQVLAGGTVTIHEVDGSYSNGPVSVIRVTLQPLEVQILTRQQE
jgi:glycosidase